MNTIETATIIQSELDKAAVEQATSGWMEVNEKLVKYTGGAEVKIPSLDMDGMGYSSQLPIIAKVITGLILSSGSTGVHELVAKLRESRVDS